MSIINDKIIISPKKKAKKVFYFLPLYFDENAQQKLLSCSSYRPNSTYKCVIKNVNS